MPSLIDTDQLRDRFREVRGRDQDRGYLEREKAVWTYQEKTRDAAQYERNTQFNGIEAFSDWIGQQEQSAQGQAPKSLGSWAMMPTLAKGLVDQCQQAHLEFLDAIGLKNELGEQDCEYWSLRSVQDFLFSTIFAPHPVRAIDFGAGYARNAFVFAQFPDTVYCAVDSVEKNYCAQTVVLKHLYPDNELIEYLDVPDIGPEEVEGFLGSGGRALHLPAWRLDLLPVPRFNVLLLIWVFHELSRVAAEGVLADIVRRLPESGCIFFRGNKHKHAHSIDFDRELGRLGFHEFQTLDGTNYDASLTSTVGAMTIYKKAALPRRGIVGRIYRAMRVN